MAQQKCAEGTCEHNAYSRTLAKYRKQIAELQRENRDLKADQERLKLYEKPQLNRVEYKRLVELVEAKREQAQLPGNSG